MDRRFLRPKEIAEHFLDVGANKANRKSLNLLILAIVAGAFIAFAAESSNMIAFNLFLNSDTYGLGKALEGAMFATGLMLVIIAGGELFTGNTLIVLSVLEKKSKTKRNVQKLDSCIYWKLYRFDINSIYGCELRAFK